MSLDLADSQTLTAAESTELDAHEIIIERGLRTFREVGAALMAIREGRLYRQFFSTFEAYCEARWGMMRRHAYRLIDAANVVGNLSSGETSPAAPILPTSERQARPLTALDPEHQRDAWAVVVDTAPNGKITTAHVEQVVEKQFRPKPVKAPPETPSPETHSLFPDGRQERLHRLAAILPNDEQILLEEAMRTVVDYHHYVMTHGQDGAEKKGYEYEAIAFKLNGKSSLGMCVDGGGGCLIDDYCRALPGKVPMWGQRGVFLISVDGMRAVVEVGSPLMGASVSFHAVDLDQPFISPTGFKSHGPLKISLPMPVNVAAENAFRNEMKSKLWPIEGSNKEWLAKNTPVAVQAWREAQEAEERLAQETLEKHQERVRALTGNPAPPTTPNFAPSASILITLFTTKIGRKEWLLKLGGPSTWPLDKMDIDEAILKAYAAVCREFDPNFTPGPHNLFKEAK